MPVSAETKEAIRRCLMKGGFCQVNMGGSTRMLSHTLLDRPMKRMPWPFGIFQPHNVRYIETLRTEPNDLGFSSIEAIAQSFDQGDRRVFRRREIDAAILHFLRDVDSSEDILVVEDP